ncbi:MAG: T9SS type A sorting domain-containing protein, partial [candidate division Zixibacteria bacterium]|nr:T9SS type A sorting domain-containing protein [candidate division Zixibacteria bacterium]
QLIIQWDTAPFNDTLSYKLEHPQAYYSLMFGEEYEDMGPGLVILLHDAIVAADQDSEYFMADYDAYIVFHAGSGREVDINGDTPGDIWSADIPLADLREIIANDDPTYRGIPVDEGNHFVTSGMLVPETSNQDDYYIGLQGSLFHEFGHQLGLPDLYDTSGYSIGVAGWALMGSGGYNDNSYFPSELCAWAKYYLGWIEPEIITQNGQYTVHAIEDYDDTNTELYKIPINSHEYFLIENRQFTPGQITPCQNCPQPNLEEDNYFASLIFEPDTGDTMVYYSEKSTIIWSSNYDFALAGEGILIWHIDDDIIESNIYTNTVNYTLPKGVDLEEADGINDDLNPTYLYSAFFGSAVDPFYEENNSEFTPFSIPSSHSNNGSDTHIFITDISENGLDMTFRVEFDWTQAGFPQEFCDLVGSNSPNHGDINGDGNDEIVISSTSGNIFAFNSDGTPTVAGSENGLLGSMDFSCNSSPALCDLDGDGDLEVLTSTDNGKLYAWHGEETDLDRIVEGFPVVSSGKLSSPTVWYDDREGSFTIFVSSSEGFLHAWRLSGDQITEAPGFPVYCESGLIGDPLLVDLKGAGDLELIAIASANGKVFAFEPDGSPFDGFPLNLGHPISSGMIAGDFDRNTWKELIVTTEDGLVYAFYYTSQIVPGFPRQVSGEIQATPALADLNGNGYLEIIIPTGNYHVSIVSSNGILMAEWPNEFDQYTNHSLEPLTASPVVADIDNDNDLEILLATWDQNIQAWHHDGTPVDRFPLALGGDVGATPMIFNMDGDPYLELVATCDDGYFYAWEMPSETDNMPWPQYRQNFSLNGQLSNDYLLPELNEEGILIKESVYVYPNPAKNSNPKFRYRIGQPAGVRIKIYDVSGDLVAELIGTAYEHIDNEVEWDISDIAGGIYLAQVYAQSGLTKTHKTVKVAITK